MSPQIGATHECLSGGGEMGRLMRAHDWSATLLGQVSDWPQSLKTAVRIILGSRYPMFIWWGRELINLYNDAYLPMLGKRHPNALGKSAPVIWSEIWDIIGPQTEAVLYEGRATWNEEKLLVLERNGYPEEAYFTFSYSPIPGDGDGIGGIFCALTEDTERVLGQRRMRTLRELSAKTTGAKTVKQACQSSIAVFNDNPFDLPFAAIYLVDGDGKAARLAGNTRLPKGSAAAPTSVELIETNNQRIGWPLQAVMQRNHAEIVADLAQRFGDLPGGAWSQSPQTAVVLPVNQSGQSRLAGFVLAGVSPLRPFDDDYRGFMDLVAGQISASLSNATAFDEEKKRAESLADLDRAKTAFFANVSHEFRTPLTLMLGPVENMLASGDAKLSAVAQNQLEVVNRNGQRLLRLVNTLLDFSRIEAGRVQASYVLTDLATFTAEVASNFRSACERAGLRLVVDCQRLSQPVYVDREMWEKIVLNLISNAFKFTFEGEIAITLRESGQIAELQVRDTGTGISHEEMPRLFERFHRIESALGRTHEGSGIGLALVQELVKLHGGSITAESAVRRGTTFTVSIPFGSGHLPSGQTGMARTTTTAAGASPYIEEALRWLPDNILSRGDSGLDSPPISKAVPFPPHALAQEGAENRPRVLVADDNADMRYYVERLLSEQFEVEAVPDGEAALAVARERPPDLILTDVMMPRLDGFGLLKAVRADRRTSGIPVIMLSARAGEESRIEGIETGADDYLVKPFSARVLLARVGAQLQLSRLRRESEQAIRKNQEIFKLVHSIGKIGQWEWNSATDENKWSPEIEALYGLQPGTFGGTYEAWTKLLHPDDVAKAEEDVHRAMATGKYFTEFRVIWPDGSTHWLEARAHVLKDDHGKPVRITGVNMDVTERKRIEEALRETDRRKDEFLATLAHELRNPLAPIRNAVELLRRGADGPAFMEETCSIMERQIRHMVQLIDDLMDISRVTSGKLRLRKERVDLAATVQSALEEIRPLIEASGHELTVTMPPEPIHLDADPTRLAQVFSNLLNNAAKYTEKRGRIWLTVEQLEGQVSVSVRDTGIGIPAEHLTRIFDMFSQVTPTPDRSQGGLGIGLALVRGLVELQGGTIDARSSGPGMGSEFVVRLPVIEVPVQEPPQEPKEDDERFRSSVKYRILVVDDNADTAESLAMILRRMGNEIQTAHDGLEAVQAAATFRPEVVLLDIGLPKMNGYEAAKLIRDQSGNRKVAIIAMTGWGQKDDIRRALEAGFDHHLTKPVEPAALSRLLALITPPIPMPLTKSRH
jgi:PAS domain S-box-containing protein